MREEEEARMREEAEERRMEKMRQHLRRCTEMKTEVRRKGRQWYGPLILLITIFWLMEVYWVALLWVSLCSAPSGALR